VRSFIGRLGVELLLCPGGYHALACTESVEAVGVGRSGCVGVESIAPLLSTP
jgi:hypothetical protein